ncbi:cobalamin-binding protein [Tepidanaerobacter syntrophicus]|uniref:Methanogenic corrinoid protein MtbC1 n=7 Tax=Tepidanaerobacter syntrophicus TaxID=224999 RepID=A0A0U9HEG3_9FIRM|nr:cobalamin-dependent protein [Tepidanaerobacter syntrophicus]GAQ25050.1 methanogenic corrinoid protein MtbC1 [Tepidanaerobacter syntrophicus]GLI50611.1 cobalamin-binding protein [Tepidanaerobacter syntrophicus]
MSDFKHLTEALGNLDEEEVLRILKDFVASNPSQEEAQKAVEACQDGMNIVGEKFETGEYFVGDLIFAGELLNQAIEILKPVIGSASEKKIGTIVLGTVHGDLHDIGKNIFRNMAEAAGFQVYDLGIDQPVEAFVEKVKEVHPDIVGLSGVLTLALEAMKETIDGLKEAGLRDKVKVIIGGNPVNQEVCEHVGADAWTTNAAEGVKICQGWVK